MVGKQEVERPFYKLFCWQILERLGESSQLDMVVEECLELALAVRHYERRRPNARKNIIEEMADVSLALDQLREIFLVKDEEIENIRREKLIRLMTKLEMEMKDVSLL